MGEITKLRKSRLDELFLSFEMVSEGATVYVCDMEYDYSRWSKHGVEFFGLPGEYMEKAGEIWEDHIHPDDRQKFRDNIGKLFDGTEDTHDLQYRAKAVDGTYKTCLCRGTILHDKKGAPRYFVGILRNQNPGEAIDELTGLPNQAIFFRELQNCLDNRIPVTVTMMGTSHFSRMNDLYGYAFANRVLQHSSRYIYELFKDTGMVCRLDGIKLAVISRNTAPEEIEKRYKRLQEVVGRTFKLEGKRIDLPVNGASIYVDSFHLDTSTIFSCLTHAYEHSKHDKEGNFSIFENGLADDTRKKMDLLNVVRSSVSRSCEGFENYYQPIVDAHTGKLRGAEALIRWHDEEGNTVPPNDFIPLLESDALFPVLGKWILRTALEDIKEILPQYPDFVINVNLSYAQLKRPDFVSMVKEAMRDIAFPPQNLCLELTERCRLVDIQVLKNAIFSLRQEGVRFALDDFGTGFSSIGILKDFECDVVKIDRGFVKNVDKDEKEEKLVAVLTQMSSIYNASTCVEGIESREMVEVLRKYPVGSFQGYYYSRPVPMREFKEKIKEF